MLVAAGWGRIVAAAARVVYTNTAHIEAGKERRRRARAGRRARRTAAAGRGGAAGSARTAAAAAPGTRASCPRPGTGG